MNCLEFRRALAVRPRQLDAGERAHRDECVRCAQAMQQALRFESLLERSLAIPVRADRADRILLAQTTQSRQQHFGRRRKIWRIAAAITLSIAVGGVSWLALAPQQSYAAMAMAHLDHEPMALVARDVVPGVRVRELFERVGITLQHSPGDLNFLRLCPVGGQQSLHMVIQRPSGPVSLIFVPNVKVRTHDFSEGKTFGREIAIGGGSLVMFAADRNEFAAIESGFRAAI